MHHYDFPRGTVQEAFKSGQFGELVFGKQIVEAADVIDEV